MTDYVNTIKEYIIKFLNIPGVQLSDEYYYNSIVFCIIDSVFSINTTYASARNTVIRFCSAAKLERLRAYGSLPSNISGEYGINDFLHYCTGKSYESLAHDTFGNRQRTSPSNGVLKAQAVCEFAQILGKHGIFTFKDLPRIYGSVEIENEIKSIRGQKSGLSLSYFYMLAGCDDMIYADRHVLSFIKEATGDSLYAGKATSLLSACVSQLKDIYPNISCRLLTHAIWLYKANSGNK